MRRIRALIKKAPPGNDGLQINDVILEVIALVRGEAVKNGVSLRTDLAEGLPGIRRRSRPAAAGDPEPRRQCRRGDERRLRRAAGAGHPHGVDGSGGVLVAVRDSGPGLSAAGRERLFEPFYTTKPSGLGMGLSICRSIVESHAGRLWAAANTPQGAIFQFTLPAQRGS